MLYSPGSMVNFNKKYLLEILIIFFDILYHSFYPSSNITLYYHNTMGPRIKPYPLRSSRCSFITHTMDLNF